MEFMKILEGMALCSFLKWKLEELDFPEKNEYMMELDVVYDSLNSLAERRLRMGK